MPNAQHDESDSQPHKLSASPSLHRSDLLCFSHLRWHFVTQRPQHLLTRAAQTRRVFFWEEPYWDADDNGDGTPTLEVMQEGAQLWVLRPHLPRAGNADDMQRDLLRRFMQDQHVATYTSWYYTPMALGFTDRLTPEATVYDCMDELTGFLGAPPALATREQDLFRQADVVFTGGMSLYEAKRKQHPNVHAFPSSIDVPHFAQALSISDDPTDQAAIPHPRAGFFGVLDERFDHALVREVAALRPDVHFVFIGPVVKINSADLPHAANIHYLGGKSYAELPAYLAGWDVALLPFALNESTRFISPTKTPEYLAAGKPVVSSAIHDVVAGYGNEGLVAIAHTPQQFAQAIDAALEPQSDAWRKAVAAKLAGGSWDRTWSAMNREIARVTEQGQKRSAEVKSASVASYRNATGRPVRSERYDYFVVGAGLAGAVLAERLANGMGKRVLIIDKRDHVAGNTFDYHDDAGVLVHKYGPHIFHTNSNEVVQYLSKFTSLAQLRAPRSRFGRRKTPAHPYQSGHHQPAL